MDSREKGRVEHIFLDAHGVGLRTLCGEPENGRFKFPVVLRAGGFFSRWADGQANVGDAALCIVAAGLLASGAIEIRAEFRWRPVMEKIPFLLLAAGDGAATFVIQQRYGGVRTLQSFPLEARLANIPYAYVRYIGKNFWPSGLAIEYPFRSLGALEVGGSIFVLGFVTIMALLRLRRSRTGCGLVLVFGDARSHDRPGAGSGMRRRWRTGTVIFRASGFGSWSHGVRENGLEIVRFRGRWRRWPGALPLRRAWY